MSETKSLSAVVLKDTLLSSTTKKPIEADRFQQSLIVGMLENPKVPSIQYYPIVPLYLFFHSPGPGEPCTLWPLKNMIVKLRKENHSHFRPKMGKRDYSRIALGVTEKKGFLTVNRISLQRLTRPKPSTEKVIFETPWEPVEAAEDIILLNLKGLKFIQMVAPLLPPQQPLSTWGQDLATQDFFYSKGDFVLADKPAAEIVLFHLHTLVTTWYKEYAQPYLNGFIKKK